MEAINCEQRIFALCAIVHLIDIAEESNVRI